MLQVLCVCLAAKGDDYRSVVDVVQGACATIIRGSASLSLSITLLPWSSLSNVCRGHRFVLVGAYVGALNDNLVSLGVKLCVGRFRG